MASISAVVGVDRGPGAVWPITAGPVSVSTKRAREILRINLGLRERSSITDAFFWSGPLCGWLRESVLVLPRIAGLGAQSAPRRYWQPAKGLPGISRGRAPWLVLAALGPVMSRMTLLFLACAVVAACG